MRFDFTDDVELTSTFHGLTSLPFPRRCEADTADESEDHTDEMLVVRVRGERDPSVSISDSSLWAERGELGGSEGSSGLGVRRSCLMSSLGARDSASRCRKPGRRAGVSGGSYDAICWRRTRPRKPFWQTWFWRQTPLS